MMEMRLANEFETSEENLEFENLNLKLKPALLHVIASKYNYCRMATVQIQIQADLHTDHYI